MSAILLKGPSIAEALYRDGALRAYSDIDILISPADSPRAEALLRSLGFQVVPVELSDGRELPSTTWMRAPDRPAVDLHVSLPWVGAAPASVWESLCAHTTTLQVRARTVTVLDSVGLALHIALHAVWHGQTGVQTQEDLARAVNTFPVDVWGAAADLARRLSALDAFAAGLRMNRAGERLADELGLTDAIPPRLALAAWGPRGGLTLERVRQRDGLAARASLTLRILFPPRRFMFAWTPLARRGPAALAAAYAWRLAVLARRSGPALRAVRRARRRRSGSVRTPV